jgi:chlorite dismutase
MREVSTKEILGITAAVSIGVVVVSALVNQAKRKGPTVIPGRVRRLAEALFKNAGGHPGSQGAMHMPQVPPPELREVGAPGSDGERQYLEKRLYMQLRVLDVDVKAMASIDKFIDDLKKALAKVPCVLYQDSSVSGSIGLLVWSDNPAVFTDEVNEALLNRAIVGKFTERVGWTMFGKTYSNGHEKDLEEYLFKKPIRNVCKDEWEWALWYPLRRKGPFYVQPPADQCRMLLHHAAIGKAFSDVGAAHDVRLKCFGMDGKDNEYVVGIIGDDLHCLSRVVEEMRKTRHTAEFLESLGPFFVGKKIWTNNVPLNN